MIDITHIRPLFLYLIGLLLMSCGGKGGTEEALLEELDRCIEERAAYYAPREHQVDSLQALLAEPCSANKRFELVVLPGQRHGFGDMNDYFFWKMADWYSRYLIGDRRERPIDIAELNND